MKSSQRVSRSLLGGRGPEVEAGERTRGREDEEDAAGGGTGLEVVAGRGGGVGEGVGGAPSLPPPLPEHVKISPCVLGRLAGWTIVISSCLFGTVRSEGGGDC